VRLAGPAAHRLDRLAALAIVAALAVTAARRLSLSRVMTELAVARPAWIALALLGFVTILPLWALQWRVLAPGTPRTPVPTMLGVVAMTSTVLNTAPLLVGEAAGIYFLVAEAGLSRAAALSVLAMDQLFVGVAKLCVLAAAAASVALPPWMARGAQGLAVGVAVLVLIVAAAAWHAGTLTMSAMGRALPPRLARAILTAGAALAPIRSPARSGGALALALAKKFAEALAILCVQRAFGVALAPESALVVLAAVNLATLLPIVPGNLGIYEGAVVLAYSYFGVSPERALGIALVQHACYFAALALPGYRWLARRATAGSSPAAT
jgi:uncharacterized membrane protein YbhN (UPF0104 family)